MSFKQISELRKSGKLQEALMLAESELNAHPDDLWGKRAAAWVYYDLMKKAATDNKGIDLIFRLGSIANIHLPATEKMIFNQLAWVVGKFLYHATAVDTVLLDRIFALIKPFSFSKPDDSYTFLLKSFTKQSEHWNGYFEFVNWWGLDNFQSKDFDKVQLKDGKLIISDVERIYIAVSKSLLQEPVDMKKIELFIPSISKLCHEHPEMQYPTYYYAKLHLALGDKDKFLKAFISFARQKKRDFWVWDLLSGAFDKNTPEYFVCLCRALSCGAPTKFSLNVKEKMAAALIIKNRLPEAKHEIMEAFACRNKENWHISNNLQLWMADEKLQKIEPTKSNRELYLKYAPQANKILYYDITPVIIVVENVNLAKKIIYFVTSKQKSGGFLYNNFRISPEPGMSYSVRFFEQSSDKSPDFFKAVTVEPTHEKPSKEIYKVVSGELKIKSGNSFGFLNHVFVPPDLISRNNLKNGDKTKLVALLSYNKKHKNSGWKAVKINN